MPRTNAAAASAAVERFVKQLVITYKAVVLYPSASAIPRENASDAIALLEEVLAERAEMRLEITKGALLYEGEPIFADRPSVIGFARELYNRMVSEIRFHAGADGEALVAFLGLLRIPAEEIMAGGGLSSRLWDAGVDAISVVESTATLVDSASDTAARGPEAAQWPPDESEMDAALEASAERSARDRRLFERMVFDTEVLHAYLVRGFERHGGDAVEAARDIDVAGIAHAADVAAGERRAEALQCVAAAILTLESEQRRAVIAVGLLPGSRADASVAALVRQIGVDEVCNALVEGVDASEISTDALSRALRSLTLISMAGRDEVLDSAGAAMRSAGIEEAKVGAVLEAVAPTRLVERGRSEPAQVELPAESILRLVDLAPVGPGTTEGDPDVAALQDEVAAGVTDGEIVGILVTLVTVDTGAHSFAKLMDDIEVGLGLLIESGEFEVAADAAESLIQAADSARPEKQMRFSEAVARLAGAEEMRAVHRALRLYRTDSSEHEACTRLLKALGTLAIDPLLEVMADEPDMAARKSLVGLISTVADRHIEDVGERVSDSRWYVVRNVVSILGATRRGEALPFLGRTLKHTDARVRRETVRAIAAIPDTLSPSMLIASLGDEDAQNVRIAARYLGKLKTRDAVNALERVALGEGRGNRDQGPRIEAIEALGSIGAPEALPTLTALASRKRGIRSGRGNRSVAAAAESAAAVLTALSEGAVDE